MLQQYVGRYLGLCYQPSNTLHMLGVSCESGAVYSYQGDIFNGWHLCSSLLYWNSTDLLMWSIYGYSDIACVVLLMVYGHLSLNKLVIFYYWYVFIVGRVQNDLSDMPVYVWSWGGGGGGGVVLLNVLWLSFWTLLAKLGWCGWGWGLLERWARKH